MPLRDRVECQVEVELVDDSLEVSYTISKKDDDVLLSERDQVGIFLEKDRGVHFGIISSAGVSGEATGKVTVYLRDMVSSGDVCVARYVSYSGTAASGEMLWESKAFEIPGSFTTDSAEVLKQRKQREDSIRRAYEPTLRRVQRSQEKTGEINELLLLTAPPKGGAEDSKKLPPPSGGSAKPDRFAYRGDDEFLRLVVDDVRVKKCVVYAGAGLSMSPPSCSPSWWSLMNDTLRAVIEACPGYEDRAAKIMSDCTRNPEEIMETFYMVLEERLFSLFNVLEEGSPNANHRTLALMAKQGLVAAIFTTNFDIFIERALQEAGVPYRVIVTEEEYAAYNRGDPATDAPLAVLKIHGTLDRPESIVAVSHHYKEGGKGFSGEKATALAGCLQRHPMLVLGYSGWDFIHANYQAFWKSITRTERVYWLNLKGYTGGPNLGQLLGSHIGEQLVLGEGYLPHFTFDVVDTIHPDGTKELRASHDAMDADAVYKEMLQKRAGFMVRWVQQLPLVAIMCITLIEGQRVGEKSQKRAARAKKYKADAEATESTSDLTSRYTELAMQMASGKITMEEYTRMTQIMMLDTTFRTTLISRAKKEELKGAIVDATNKAEHPSLRHPTVCHLAKALLGNLCSQIAEVADEDAPCSEILEKAFAFLDKKLEFVKLSEINGPDQLYYKHRASLQDLITVSVRGSGEEQSVVEEYADDVAKKAAEEKWDDDRVREAGMKLSQRVCDIMFGQLSVDDFIGSLAEVCLRHYTEAHEHYERFYQDLATALLGLLECADKTAVHFMMDPKCQTRFLTPLQRMGWLELHRDEYEDDPASFKAQERQVAEILAEHPINNDTLGEFCTLALGMMNGPVELLRGVREADNDFFPTMKQAELLAGYELFGLLCLYHFTRYTYGYSEENDRSHKGHYPRERMNPLLCEFLMTRAKKLLPALHHPRLRQRLYSLLALCGEAADDLGTVRDAVLGSLALTGGKVTELTPYPIPEALAVQYMRVKDYDNAAEWFRTSLNGIKLCVVRLKVDSIVLQACLLEARMKSVEDALRVAFTYSPAFSSTASWIPPTGARQLLVDQVEVWVNSLGFTTVDQARDALLSTSN